MINITNNCCKYDKKLLQMWQIIVTNVKYKILQIIDAKITNNCYKCGSDKRTNKRKQSTG